MSENVDLVSSLRARTEFVSGELRKLVEEKVDDPAAQAKAKKIADAVEVEDARRIEADTSKDVVDVYKDGASKYTAKTQPRDAQGKFRLVLARLKQNLGTSGNQGALEKIQEAENFDNAGDYAGAVAASSELLGLVDRLDTGALNAKSVEGVRATTSELGKVIANLPLPFENQAQKIRYSDLPSALKTLADSLIERVEQKIGKEDADIATQDLRGFMSGSDYYSQAEVSSQLNKLLRLLT
jgi:hypothetical protein